ncbi:hypothetical protein GGX14DRAFT_623212 [Mycena pura]|uniref:F-box domain-containing protein n=1 Tax=Mycena pura TaxID=153505 RepID=A0AAD6VJ88_9AGAR|nr:hypothetical protein GGX14DRAFT_623212 [Mycena pura]
MGTQQFSVPGLALPNELTEHIFLHCLPHGRVRPNPKTGPLLVTQICRHWRAVALLFPALWASIVLDFDEWTAETVISQQIALARLWLSRASRSPLSITINGPMHGRRLPAGLIDLIKSSSAQWGRLELSISAPDVLELCEVAGPFPHLQVVAIQIPNHFDEKYAEFRAPFLDAPKLQVLRLSGAFVGCFECEPGRERSQSILAVEFPIHQSTTEIFQMFKKFPNLRHLIITSEYPIYHLPLEPSVPCPPLRSLVLGTYYDVTPLKHLTLPTLEDLKIVFAWEGYGQLIVDFVARSSCTLTVLGLECLKDNPLELEGALRAAPSVVSLFLGFESFSKSVCLMLHRLEVLPYLTNKHIETWVDGVDKWDIFLGLVQARPTLLVADFVGWGDKNPPPTAQQISGFEAAAERGMRITLKTEDAYDKPWQWSNGPQDSDLDENFEFQAPVINNCLPHLWNRYPPTG